MSLVEYIQRREARIFLAGWWGGFGFAGLIFLAAALVYLGK